MLQNSRRSTVQLYDGEVFRSWPHRRIRSVGGLSAFRGVGPSLRWARRVLPASPARPRSPSAVWDTLRAISRRCCSGISGCGIKASIAGAIRVQPLYRGKMRTGHEPATHRGHNRLPSCTIQQTGPAARRSATGQACVIGRAFMKKVWLRDAQSVAVHRGGCRLTLGFRPPHSRRDQPSPQFCAAYGGRGRLLPPMRRPTSSPTHRGRNRRKADLTTGHGASTWD